MATNDGIKFALFLMFLYLSIPVYAQNKFEFAYDCVGNRIGREQFAVDENLEMLLAEDGDEKFQVELDSGRVFIAVEKNRNINMVFKDEKKYTKRIYMLYDMSGRIVKKKEFNETKFKIELDELPRGIYVLQIQRMNKVITLKINLDR